MRAASREVLSEIRGLTADLVLERAPRPGHCSHWDDRHCRVARSHGVSPWLYTRLQGAPAAGVPSAILESWYADCRSCAAHSLRRKARIQKLLEVFNERNIPVIVLKGAYVAHMVYPDPALRQMADLDLMVREEDRDRSAQLLSDVGYDLPVESTGHTRELELPSLTCVRSGCVTDWVDLHWSIQAMDYYRLPSSLVWEDAVETRFLGCRAYVLSPELNFMHLLLHALTHKYLLRSWLDLALLWARTAVESLRLLELATCLGVTRPMYWAFLELSRNWRIDIPLRVGDVLKAHEPKMFEDLVIRHRYRRYWRVMARIGSLPGWRRRLAYIRYLFMRRF